MALAGCASRIPSTPVPKHPPPARRIAESAWGVRTICVESVSAALKLPHGAERLDEYVELLRYELGRGGIALLAGEKVLDIYKREFRRAGDVYDRATGRADADRYARANSASLRALNQELGCQAVLRVRFETVKSNWQWGKASWDGVTDPVPGSSSQDYGWVMALSVWMTLDDMEGREIYFGAGGVQVLAGLARRGVLSAPQESQIDPELILADKEKNRRSIQVALAPLLANVTAGQQTPPAGANP